jgi:hypothetical protein
MLILGIDPGSRATGWGAIRCDGPEVHLVEVGTLSRPAAEPLAKRLAALAAEIGEVADRIRPGTAVLESPFHGMNARSLIVLAQARGALIAALASRGHRDPRVHPGGGQVGGGGQRAGRQGRGGADGPTPAVLPAASGWPIRCRPTRATPWRWRCAVRGASAWTGFRSFMLGLNDRPVTRYPGAARRAAGSAAVVASPLRLRPTVPLPRAGNHRPEALWAFGRLSSQAPAVLRLGNSARIPRV